MRTFRPSPASVTAESGAELWTSCWPDRRLAALAEQYAQDLLAAQSGPVFQGDHGGIGPIAWLAPNQAATQEVRSSAAMLAAPLAVGAWLSPGVRTLSQVADTLLSKTTRTIHPLSSVQQRALVERLVEAARQGPGLGAFESLAESRGLIDYLVRRISEARQLGEPPDRVAELLSRREGSVGGSIGKFYQQYTSALQRHDLVDRAARLQVAVELVEELDLRLACLVIGFHWQLSPIERRLVEALARRSDRVLVEAPGPPEVIQSSSEEEAPRLSGARAEAERWSKLFPDIRLTCVENTADDPATIATIQQRMFDDEQQTPSVGDPQQIRVVAGSSEQNELRRIARRIKRLLLDGATPESIVVAARRWPDRAQRLLGVLAEYGVPSVAEAEPMIGATPVLQTMLAAACAENSDWAHEECLALVARQELACLSKVRQSRPLRYDAERFIRLLQVPSGKAYIRSQADKYSQSENATGLRGDLAACAPGAQAAFETLAEALDQLPAEATPLAWYDALLVLLEQLDFQFVAEDRLALQTLEQAFSDIETLAHWRNEATPHWSLNKLIAALEEVADRLPLHSPGVHQGCVRIVSAESAAGIRYEHLFLVNLAETAFAAIGETPLWQASDSAQTERIARQEKEMLLFYELVTSPTKSLTLSYTALDDKAQELKPCPYVEELARLFEPLLLPTTVDVVEELTTEAPVSMRELRLDAIARTLQGKPEALGRLLAHHPNLLSVLRMVDEREQGDTFGGAEGMFSSAPTMLAEQYGPDRAWSASQLEVYAECPFKFFGRHVLRAEPLEEIELEVDYRRRGSIVHDALAKLHERLRNSGQTPTADELVTQLEQAIRETIDAAGLPLHEAALAAIEARQAESWAGEYPNQVAEYEKRWAAFDEPLTPHWFEARFGPTRHEAEEDDASTDEPFELELPDGDKILLTGRVDRIDVGRIDGQVVFSVVDYKTGQQTAPSREKIESGSQLQLVLYTLAVEKLFFADEGALPVDFGYWSLQKKGFITGKGLAPYTIGDGKLQPNEAWAELVDEVAKRVQQIIGDIRAGRFPMHNQNKDCGKFCEYKTVCRVNQVRSLGKGWPPHEEAAT